MADGRWEAGNLRILLEEFRSILEIKFLYNLSRKLPNWLWGAWGVGNRGNPTTGNLKIVQIRVWWVWKSSKS